MNSIQMALRCFKARLAGVAWLVSVSSPLFLTASAWAQKPTSPARSEGMNILPWAIALGVIVVVVATAFINPKRSHLS